MLKNAKWIKSPENKEEACYDFYKVISISKEVKSATLYASAIGMYCAFINGKRVSEELFTPYWTEYTKRVQYQSYDVTKMLSEKAELSFLCAEGWAVGYLKAGGIERYHYAKNISLIFSLDIEYTDGSKESIISDESVLVRTSQIISSSIYHGETVDRSVQIKSLGNALLDKAVKTNLIPQEGEKVCEQERLKPVSIFKTPKGELIIDFGQNLAGFVEITVCGEKGDIVEISHAEILDKDKNFYTENLRTAKQKNTYILSGGKKEVFKPTFSWQGFRYIRLDKYPSRKIDLDNFCAVVVHSDMKRTGSFTSGNEKLNKLYHNIIWGQKSNFIDVPTDCPQRDERLGWTGDAQVFVKTATLNFDVEKFFSKWLLDLSACQFDDGGVFWFIPTCNLHFAENVSSGWGDAAVICPWEIYLAYGNKDILERQFSSMKKWVDYIHNFGEEEFLWLGGVQFGDWLALDNSDGSYNGKTPFDFISSAYFAKSTSLLIKAGEVLGKDMTEYKTLLKNISSAFEKRFMKDSLPIAKTQTAYAIALCFDLCKNPEKVAEGLNEMVKANGCKLTTGFLGTPYLLFALSDNGYIKTAYNLLLQEEYPSWLYSVNHGATTIWEHWDGVKEDGTFWSSDMNSYNHYAYGAVYDWIFSAAAGIKTLPDGAGYSHVLIKPAPDRRLGYLKAGLDTRHGHLSSYWKYEGNEIIFEFIIPEKTVAEIILPDGRKETVSGGKYIYKTGASYGI